MKCRIAQLITCPTIDTSRTADPGVASLIPAQYHTCVKMVALQCMLVGNVVYMYVVFISVDELDTTYIVIADDLASASRLLEIDL